MVHSPSAADLVRWRSARLGLGAVLLLVAVLGVYLALDGLDGEGSVGSGQALVTAIMAGASGAIGLFGLRYLLLGLRGGGVHLYERAVEADFFDRFAVPVRRTVPLVRVEMGGTDRQTRATAVVATGHAFALSSAFVQGADLWYLGSLGSRPVLPGGRSAKDRIDAGELRRERAPAPEPLPDHGPPWPTEEVRRELEEARVAREARAPSEAPSPAAPPGPSEPPMLPDFPVTRAAPARRAEGIVPRAPPVITVPRATPASPEFRPAPPPEAAPEELPEEPSVAPPPEPSEEWELEELPPPEALAPTTPSPAAASPATPPPAASSEWELEELPPPEEAPRPRPTSEWEEL